MTPLSNIVKGLTLIELYESDAVLSSDGEQIWAGSGNGNSITDITEEGKNELEKSGWFIDESLGCWTFLI